MPFLENRQATCLQLLNKWMYTTAISRAQVKVKRIIKYKKRVLPVLGRRDGTNHEFLWPDDILFNELPYDIRLT